jgi:hypothetical protein
MWYSVVVSVNNRSLTITKVGRFIMRTRYKIAFAAFAGTCLGAAIITNPHAQASAPAYAVEMAKSQLS